MTTTKTRVQGKTIIKSEKVFSGKDLQSEVNSVIPAGAIKQKGIENKYLDARGYNPVKSEARKQEILLEISKTRAELRSIAMTTVRVNENTIKRPLPSQAKEAMNHLSVIDKFINNIFVSLSKTSIINVQQFA